MESWIVCPHHLPLKWFIPFLLISSYTCKMTSESCLCLYLPLPSYTGLYTESGSEQEREKGGIRQRGKGNKRAQNRISLKREEGEQVITKWERQRRKEHSKPNKISMLNLRRWANNPIMCGTLVTGCMSVLLLCPFGKNSDEVKRQADDAEQWDFLNKGRRKSLLCVFICHWCGQKYETAQKL